MPQLTERLLPFSVLVGAMACYLALSRRNELVVARSAGMSAWQFVTPALIGAFVIGLAATAVYNPLSAAMREWSKRLEAEIFGDRQIGMQQSQPASGCGSESVDGQSMVYAASSQEQGVRLDGVSVFTFDPAGHEMERIEAKRASLEPGHWRLEQAVVYVSGAPPRDHETYLVKTNLTAGAGPGKLFDPGDRAVLGSSYVYRDRRTLRLGRGRLQTAISNPYRSTISSLPQWFFLPVPSA